MSRFIGLVAAVVALCFAGAVMAKGGGGGGGSHGRTTTTVIVVGGYVIHTSRGPGDANMPLELTDAPLLRTEGEMSPGDVIAQHTLRVKAARVLLEPTSGGFRGDMPAGSVLAAVLTPTKGFILWCDVTKGVSIWWGPVHDCLVEENGKFAYHGGGASTDHFLGLDQEYVGGTGKPLPAPVAYREATPQERPTALLGYKWCEGDGVNAPPRFALAVSVPSESKWTSVPVVGCRYGFWPDPKDHSVVDVDGLRVTVAAVPGTDRLRFSVAGRIPPIAEIAPLSATDSVHAVGARPAAPTTAAADPGAAQTAGSAPVAPDRALLSTGAPVAGQASALKPGQTFLTMPVRHGVTGVLQNEVRVRAAFESGDVIPVNQPLFGLPIRERPGQVVWCAPRRTSEGPWRTICLYERDGAVMSMEISTGMMAVTLPWTKARLASPMTIQRTSAVSLPPMTLSYVFVGFTDPTLPTRFARVEARLDWGEGPKAITAMSAAVGADGLARFKLLDGEFTFRPRPPASKSERPEMTSADYAIATPPSAVAPF